jgi:hypothetical protein
MVLVRGLPDSSRTWGGHEWGVGEELAALTVEMTHLVAQILVAANSKNRGRPKLLHIPRPTGQATRPASAGARLRQFAATIRGR